MTMVALALASTGCSVFGDDSGAHRQAASKVATDFLSAWQRADVAGAAALTDQPSEAQQGLSELASSLSVSATKIAPGPLAPADGEPTGMPFDVTLSLTGLGDFAYGSRLSVVKAKSGDNVWKVHWAPSVLHPQLTDATKLARVRTLPPRAAIEAADGSTLHSPTSVIGALGAPTKDALANAGPTATRTDQVGLSGLQYVYQRRLAGTPGGAVRVVDRGSDATVATLKEFPSSPGQPVRTTIDPHIQAVADRAVADGPKKTNGTAFVVLRPSTGAVLAVANANMGFDAALTGRYAPGSTFKVITSTTLFGAGLTPSTPVPCEKTVTINGRTFHNSEGEQFGTIPLSRAFAVSCNTAFISQASRISLGSLSSVAKNSFGLGGPWQVGVPAFSGSVPVAAGRDSLGAFMIGQDQVTMSPLAMVSVAGTVSNGVFHQPVLVKDPELPPPAEATPLPATVASNLRTMMRTVTSQGTAAPALAGKVPADVGVKTGTAEHGANAAGTNAWMIGFHRDLAFGGVVQDGGFGVDAVGPIVREFLNGVG
jgi:cell division protein FtsI/penicillin-binding protein 2